MKKVLCLGLLTLMSFNLFGMESGLEDLDIYNAMKVKKITKKNMGSVVEYKKTVSRLTCVKYVSVESGIVTFVDCVLDERK